MSHLIYEKREFKDRNSGVTIEYDYIAIKGGSSDGNTYEVQLKNLVQSEKQALKMMYDMENPSGMTVASRKATDDEVEGLVSRPKSAPGSLFDDEE